MTRRIPYVITSVLLLALTACSGSHPAPAAAPTSTALVAPISPTTSAAPTQAVLLKSLTELHRYETASGEFQVVADLTNSSFLPSFLQGNNTMFIGVGTDNAYVDFSTLTNTAVTISADNLSVTIKLPHAQLEAATLDVKKSYVSGPQQSAIDSLFSDPNTLKPVYVLATQKITDAAKQSGLVADAERNTTTMLTALMHSLGFTLVTVKFG